MKSLFKHIVFKGGLRLFFWLGKLLRKQQLPKISKIIATILYRLPWSRKSITLDNLKIAFENKYNEQELKDILKKFLQEVISIALEVAFIVKKKEPLSHWAVAAGLEHLDDALKQGKGVIALSAHIGNIPIMLAWLAEKGYPVAVLFKEGKYLPEGFLYRLISSYKIYPIPFCSDREVPKEIIKALNKNMIVFILADQSRRGVYARFFGKLVQCQKGAFLIALRKMCPVIPVFITRQENIYKIKVYQSINMSDDKNIVEYIEQYNSLLESIIMQHPEQYYWFHRRFKKMKLL
ncbi:MAG TPA: lysophospholipid acyltransferase family protein [Thermodesulfovibrio thiophilus]|nr:lysophospholipid acyltransferase family protein [Thermodesulfovibrio thiophilus]HQA04023.1 lysophospholipid acyltransferase family protein [Thermodesulfovibrio thiophilus]